MTADYTLTFGASSVQLSSVLVTGTREVSAKFLALQPDGGNANPIYIGGANHREAVSSTAYGFRLEKATATVPPAPFIIELSNGLIDLQEYWVNGTNGEKLHLFLKS